MKGKKVQLATIPKIRFSRVRKGMACFEPDVEYKECKFEDIDRNLPQFGVITGWFRRETALILVGRGEVHTLCM